VPSERPLVAAVIYNRLHAHMPLGIDATLRYGLHVPPTESLTQSDLANPTPYNTRLHDGLPPTPINHPGRASIAAVLQPESHGFLYFVADGKGGHVFARSYDEHLKNVAAYRATQRR